MIPLAALAVLVLAAACAAGDPRFTAEAPAGFWVGLWHGAISMVTLVIGIFVDHVHVYEVHNTGGWYDFGFLIGATSLWGASSHRAGRRRRHDAEWDEIGRKVEAKLARMLRVWAEAEPDEGLARGRAQGLAQAQDLRAPLGRGARRRGRSDRAAAALIARAAALVSSPPMLARLGVPFVSCLALAACGGSSPAGDTAAASSGSGDVGSGGSTTAATGSGTAAAGSSSSGAAAPAPVTGTLQHHGAVAGRVRRRAALRRRLAFVTGERTPGSPHWRRSRTCAPIGSPSWATRSIASSTPPASTSSVAARARPCPSRSSWSARTTITSVVAPARTTTAPAWPRRSRSRGCSRRSSCRARS
ncbi:MAG: hypothetical protein U0168_28005 [Nannocystaceae bacterium]